MSEIEYWCLFENGWTIIHGEEMKWQVKYCDRWTSREKSMKNVWELSLYHFWDLSEFHQISHTILHVPEKLTITNFMLNRY